MNGDFTRLTFRKDKHYKDVLRQQGRVDLDADWNEQADIWAHRTETETRDVVGGCGGPKHHAGFAISPGTGGDFTIGQGRYYVHGILCENEAGVAFTQQLDLPGTNSLQTAGRYVVYLDVWQRHITALDDPEIREVALGGPDTATRRKTVWQVKTGPVDANTTCASEPPPWAAASTGQLSARAEPDAQSDKPCIVPPGAGYRRLENQLYRVEIHRAGPLWDGKKATLSAAATFKWSRENGSIAARIASIAGDKITLTTSRKDSALGFAPGHWIEIIDAELELRGEPGPLAQITAVDDLVLTVDQASVIGTLPSSVNQALLPKARRWDSDPGASAVTLPATNDGFIALEDGVEVKFEAGSYQTGDYWMIPARTDHGDIEWPRDSASNPLAQLPHGIRHHYCRLAIIDVDGSGGVTLVEDCRRLFPPLTELEDCCGCCTRTVGTAAAADYRSIQEAVDSLPLGAGGHICVLEGEYSENVTIFHRHNIIISGCGERTRIISRAGVEESPSAPVIWIADSTNIRIESLSLIADESGNGVLVQREAPPENPSHPEIENQPKVTHGAMAHRAPVSRWIWLTHLDITAALRSAIEVHESDHVTICHCRIRMTDPRGAAPGIFFQGDDGLLERNTIAQVLVRKELERGEVQHVSYGVSGIQLGGGSRLVRVLENLITDMTGQGITLGSLEETDDENTPPIIIVGWPTHPGDPCDKCAEPGTRIHFKFRGENGREKQLRSPDPLEEIYLERNRIWDTGLDGIGVIGFFDLREVDEFVSVRHLAILGNQIRGCLRRAPARIEAAMATRMGYGGISLADVTELVIHDNVIEHNGLMHAQPVCGVFVAHGEGIDLSRNRILDNGGQQDEKLNGPRGGVFVAGAVAPVAVVGTGAQWDSGFLYASVRFSIPEATGFPALKVHDNIISAPLGRALTVVALGPVSVVGNQLTSGAVVRQERATLLDAATVLIFDLGVSNELYLQARSFAALQKQKFESDAVFQAAVPETRLVDGNVLFADNQCSLDLLESGQSGAFTSITILSLDDVAFQDNQCDCNLMRGQDFVLIHALLAAFSLRVTGNRFKEGLLNTPLSAMTIGLLNATAHNQATHCLLVLGPAEGLINGPNTIFINLALRDFCEGSLSNILSKFVKLLRTFP